MIYRFIEFPDLYSYPLCGRINLVPHIYEEGFGINEIYDPNLKKNCGTFSKNRKKGSNTCSLS